MFLEIIIHNLSKYLYSIIHAKYFNIPIIVIDRKSYKYLEKTKQTKKKKIFS